MLLVCDQLGCGVERDVSVLYIVTYVPLKPPHSDAASCPSACQAHKVTATNVAGKQGRTDLNLKEHRNALKRNWKCRNIMGRLTEMH